MVLVINKKEEVKKIATLLQKKIKKTTKGNLSKHFGILKRNIDGVDYQIEARKNED